MTIKIGRSKELPSQEQILKVEVELGVKLPIEYLQFLTQGNGGVPETNIFKVSTNNDSGISEFISLDRIVYEAGLIKDQIGKDFVPVAHAEGGNYLCLAVTGLSTGSVYFLDHEIPGEDGLIKLASSLKEFLEVVQPFDRKQIKLKPGQVKKAWIDPSLLKN